MLRYVMPSIFSNQDQKFIQLTEPTVKFQQNVTSSFHIIGITVNGSFRDIH